ncbi:hypothetical protein TRVL_06572 [Trypanosoma vivax]|nr:hypothetical protein TRVL_06572 [Trypanosoma vivax]
MKCLASRIMRAARVRGGALFGHYFSLKAVSRRLSKLNEGLLPLNGATGLPAHAVRQGKRWLSRLLGNKPVAHRRHRPTLATDASMCGCDAALFKDSGSCVWRVARGNESRTASHRSRGAPRHWRSVHLLKRRLEICTFALATQGQ